MLNAIPLLILPVLIYVGVAMFGGAAAFDRQLFAMTLPSGAAFALTTGTAIIALAVVTLLIEVLKSTNVKSSNSIIDHGLSTGLLIVAILLFVLMPAAGTSTFFILILLAFIDVIAGFSVSIKTAQRDFSVDRSFN